MIACFLSNISAKYYKNPSMLSRVIAKNVGDVFFWDTVYFYDSIIIAEETVWNATLDFLGLSHRIERKMGVILRCKLAKHNE